MSHTHQDYPAHPPQRPPARGDHRPTYDVISGGKFEGESTVRSDYRPPNAQPTPPVRPPVSDSNLINGGSQEREFTSEQRRQFAPKAISPSQSYKPRQEHVTSLKFDGQSTSQAEYRHHQGAKPSIPIKPPSSFYGTKEDRDFQSEAARQFRASRVDVRRPNFAPQSRVRESVPFTAESTAKSDYQTWSNARPSTSRAPQQTHQREKETRDFMSYNRLDYSPPKGVAVRESYKPKYQVAAGLPFDGQSTTKSSYTGAPSPSPAQSMKPKQQLTNTTGVSVGAPDDRQWDTEARGRYRTPPTGSSPTRRQPTQSAHVSHLPFDAESTSRSDYRHHIGAKPTTPVRKAAQSALGAMGSKEDRDFTSENRRHFIAHPGPSSVRESYAPRQSIHVSSKFEGESTTKTDYKAWKN